MILPLSLESCKTDKSEKPNMKKIEQSRVEFTFKMSQPSSPKKSNNNGNNSNESDLHKPNKSTEKERVKKGKRNSEKD